jgi:hypothetical protein
MASARNPLRRFAFIDFASFLLQRSGGEFAENAEKGWLSVLWQQPSHFLSAI